MVSLSTGRTGNNANMIPQSAGIVNLEPIIDGFMESNSYFVEKGTAVVM